MVFPFVCKAITNTTVNLIRDCTPSISDGVLGGYCNNSDDCIYKSTVCKPVSSTCVLCNGTFHAFDGYCFEGINILVCLYKSLIL